MNEQEQFLKDLENDQNRDVDVLDQPLIPEQGDEDKGGEDKGDEDGDKGGDSDDDASGLKPKNRRERRLMRKLNEERESSIFLAGKLEAREEAKKAVTEESDYLKAVERIYGTDTPEAQLATDLLKKAITGARDDAENRAYERVKSERQGEIEATRNAQKQLDDVIDDIEDTYDVTLTEAQEKSYFDLLKKMSPKNSEGAVVSLADPHAVWEIFQDRLKKPGTASRAKDLSARSMVRSGASKESSLQDDASTRFLKDAGII
jgi:hypothetical protein